MSVIVSSLFQLNYEYKFLIQVQYHVAWLYDYYIFIII